MSQKVIIREATLKDKQARMNLLKESMLGHRSDAFWVFLYQEICLQGVILGGAILFIFLNANSWGVLSILPMIPVIVFVSVYIQHYILAERHALRQSREVCGWVAEIYETSVFYDPSTTEPYNIIRQSASHSSEKSSATVVKIIGTVSLSERHRGNEGGWWLHDLAVAQAYQRKGVGLALVQEVAKEAAVKGGSVIETVTSELETAGRMLLLKAGWQCLGAYNRCLIGPLLSLLITQHSLTLPHA